MIIGWNLRASLCLTDDSEWQLYPCSKLHEKLLPTESLTLENCGSGVSPQPTCRMKWLDELCSICSFISIKPNRILSQDHLKGGRCPLTSVVCFIRRENMICSSDRKPQGRTDRWRMMLQTYSQLFLTSRPLFSGVDFREGRYCHELSNKPSV